MDGASTLYFSFIKTLSRGIHRGSSQGLSVSWSNADFSSWQWRPQSDEITGDYGVRMRNSCGSAEVAHLFARTRQREQIYVLLTCPLDLYLPVLAVFQPVTDLVFGLKQEVFEGGRSLPANTQLVFQLAHAADNHTWWRVRGHWGRKKQLDRSEDQSKQCDNSASLNATKVAKFL